MQIRIVKGVQGDSNPIYSVQFRIADLPSDEIQLITNYHLRTFVIANDGNQDITLEYLINDGIITYASPDDDQVVGFEQRMRKGLESLASTAEQRADFFKAKSETISISLRKGSGSPEVWVRPSV